MIHEIGVSKSSGFTTYFSLDQTRTLSYYRRQGSAIKHSPIDEEIRQRIDARDDRLFVAIIEGDVEFMLSYRQSLTMPNVIVYVSAPDNLEKIGIRPVDGQWQRGDRQLDLNKYIL